MGIAVDIKQRLGTREKGFTLEVSFASDDRFIVLFGPSGSGKTMTVKTIAGLMTPQAGRIVMGDRVLFDSRTSTNLCPRKRRIGYVFQDYALFPHLNLQENIRFGMKRGNCSRCEQHRERLEELMNKLEIASVAHCYPHQLSGGQQQRVALARALASNPDLLIMDEPFSALDIHLKERMRTELMQVLHKFPVPVILITHDPLDVEMFAETLVVYNNGRVEGIFRTGRPITEYLHRFREHCGAWSTEAEVQYGIAV